jgi:hypothetical protein
MSYEKRAKVVSQFNNDLTYRVLFLSSVGSVGLNLTRANYLIYQVGSFTRKCPLMNTFITGSALECAGRTTDTRPHTSTTTAEGGDMLPPSRE